MSHLDKYLSEDDLFEYYLNTAMYFAETFRIVRIDYTRIWEDDETNTFIDHIYYVNSHGALVGANYDSVKKFWVWGLTGNVMCFISGKPMIRPKMCKLNAIAISDLISAHLNLINWTHNINRDAHSLTTHLYDKEKHKGLPQ